jgi:hypothetical protein
MNKKFKKDYKKIQDKLVMRVSRYENAKTKSGFQVKMECLVDTEKNAKILGNLREINSDFDKMLSFMINKYTDYVLEEKGKDWIGDKSTRVLLQEVSS